MTCCSLFCTSLIIKYCHFYVLVKAHRAYYQPYFIRPLLVKAYFGTKDLDSFMTIAHAMYLSVMRQEDYRGNSEVAADSEDDPLAVPDKTNMISKTVYDILNNLVKDKRNAEEVERFLKVIKHSSTKIPPNLSCFV